MKESQIGEKAILTARETRNILMDLFRDGYINRKIQGNEILYQSNDNVNEKVGDYIF